MDFFKTAIDTLGNLVILIGAGMGAWGGVMLMEAYGADNPGGKFSGLKQVMAGIGLFVIGSFLFPLIKDLIPTSV